MSSPMIDLVIVNPAAAHGIYGPLGDTLIAVEPPQWVRIIASYVRKRGYKVVVIDAEGMNLGARESADLASLANARMICVAVYGHQPSASTQQMWGARQFCREFKKKYNTPIMMLGGHPSALPIRTMEEETVDYVCVGEGPETVVAMLDSTTVDANRVPGLCFTKGDQFGNPIISLNSSAPLIDINQLDGDAWDLLPMAQYRAHNWHSFGRDRQPYASIFTSLGCPYKCLRGDTVVNTIYGDFPIKDLAETFGDSGVPVYTYDPETQEAKVAQAINIRRYGKGEKLVRVNFDDGTHIDCTPDHKFLQFKWGNGKSPSSQWECEAKDLKGGAHVRALRFETHPSGRTCVTWGRRDRKLRSRMIMEFFHGPLSRKKHVHHRDGNVGNDHPTNLEVCASAKDHFARHPEIAERMRVENPTKDGVNAAWRENIGAANRGKVRSFESRERYRQSKLGDLNPNFNHGKRTGVRSRLGEVNHRVVSVEYLDAADDVYCMTVPETGWFFANNVLVKNCSFCCINAPFASNQYRMRNPETVLHEIKHLHEDYGVTNIKITDEMFVLNERHYQAICGRLQYAGLGEHLNIWAYARVDTIKPDKLKILRDGGVRWLALGIESGSKFVRDGAHKSLKHDDIVQTVKTIQEADINVIGNFMFGLRDDNRETMQQTLDLALECMPDFANFYSTMAYPGSGLYDQALKKGWKLPPSWRAYSQHNDDCHPLDTEHVDGREVLDFRDKAFTAFFTDASYVNHVRGKFGEGAAAHVAEMTSYKLKRKLLSPA
jgi:radical SAM superfamily enzyme YgiQ (UPF0313 family)